MKLRFLAAFCLITTALLSAISCKNNAAETVKNTPSVPTEKTAQSTTFYKHFRGKIGAFPVIMDLVQNNITENSGFQQLKGYYTYESYQEPILLMGNLESDGTWRVDEYAEGGNSVASFVGKFSNGTFLGTWSDTTQKKSLPFTLTEDYSDGAYKFDYQSFADSVALDKAKLSSPKAHFELNTLLPQNTEGGAGWLKNEILKNWSADTFGQIGKTPLPIEQAKTKRRDEFFKEYVEGNAEFKDSADWGMMMNWMMSYGMNLISNTADRVSLEYTNYWYSGGAHGNYGSVLATYDLKTQKQVQLTDIFKPNYQKILNAALAQAVRRNYNLKPNQPLTEVLFENSIEANDNFCVTPKGILFNYQPYEISAYAVGQIQLFIPFEALKSVLK